MDTIILLLAAPAGKADFVFDQVKVSPFSTELDQVAAWAWRPGDVVCIEFADYGMRGTTKIMDVGPSVYAVGRSRVIFSSLLSWEPSPTPARPATGFALQLMSGDLPRIGDDAIEEGAQALYATWKSQSGWVPWNPRGNSLKQDEARRDARTVLVAAWRAGLRPEIDEAMVERAAKAVDTYEADTGNPPGSVEEVRARLMRHILEAAINPALPWEAQPTTAKDGDGERG